MILCPSRLPHTLLSATQKQNTAVRSRLTFSISTQLTRHKAHRPGSTSLRQQRSKLGTAHPAPQAWSGLQSWRDSAVDNHRHWGEEGKGQPIAVAASIPHDYFQAESLAAFASKVLRTADPLQKAAITHHAWQQYKAGQIGIGAAQPPERPSRPLKPQLVPQKQVPTPKQSPLPLPVYMLHNLAHVELNAIDLAWDTVARFSPLNLHQDFYADFARVADDESRHLGWCLQRLKELGYAYGDMVAHNMLWEGAEASSSRLLGDLAGRLAVVPMSQEARGLDAGPRLAERLVGCGDNRSAAIVARIALEEKAHVAVGVSWFTRLSAAIGEEPGEAYRRCMTGLGQQEALRPPFNHASRQEVGLQQHWYDRDLWVECDKQGPMVGTNEGVQGSRLSPTDLQGLRHRMAALLDMEAAAAT